MGLKTDGKNLTLSHVPMVSRFVTPPKNANAERESTTSFAMPPDEKEIDSWFRDEVQTFEPQLRSILGRDRVQFADVDEIVQESYRRILEVRRTQEIRSPAGLLVTIAKNISRDRLRKKSYASMNFVGNVEDMRIPSLEDLPDAEMVRADEVAVLESAIRKLPQRCREVLVLRTYQKLSYKEIAERLDISVKTVETQLARAISKCRKHFRDQGHPLGKA